MSSETRNNKRRMEYQYKVKKTSLKPSLEAAWDTAPWNEAEEISISNFRPESSGHRPRVYVRMLYDDTGLYGSFFVKDRYVKCVHTEYQSSVCKDSCVEFFVRPYGSEGYFNFEFNCVGTLLCSWITDWRRTENGFESYIRLPEEDGKKIGIYQKGSKY